MNDIWLTRRWRIGLHRNGNCWRFRFSRKDYFSGKVTWFCFWRLFVVLDRTL